MSKSSLTPRQKQIVRLILAGKVNKEIAHELNIGYQTVRNQLAAAYSVLGIKSSRQIIPIAEQVKLLIAE